METLTAKATVVVASTFHCGLMEQVFEFWLERLSISATLQFTPYNQVMQQLLDSHSAMAANRDGINVILLRIEDWVPADTLSKLSMSLLSNQVKSFVQALRNAAERGSRFILCTCPPFRGEDHSTTSILNELRSQVIANLGNVPQLWICDLGDEIGGYMVRELTAPYTDRIASVPYTPSFYTAAATIVARRLHALLCPPYKVLVLDCDNTLWRGNCADLGPDDVELDHRALTIQQFAVRCAQQGMILCLCSKNDQEAVKEVFESKVQMVLNLKHVAAQQINWRPKSVNIRQLASDLSLPLESFVVIDDDPVECAEISKLCPELVTYKLPLQGEVAGFIANLWACDGVSSSQEDASRNSWYIANRVRTSLSEHLSYQEFLESLQLEITILPLGKEHLERAVQLTQRARQFNTRVTPSSIAQLEEILASHTTSCWVLTASDRFGDYGLVGLAIGTIRDQSCCIDRMTLSCRALGKHIEDTLLMHLLRHYQNLHRLSVTVPIERTARNMYAYRFFKALASDCEETGNVIVFRLACEDLFRPERSAGLPYGIRFSPTGGPASSEPANATHEDGRIEAASSAVTRSTTLAAIPTEFNTAEAILNAVVARRSRDWKRSSRVCSARTPIENQLLTIWQELIGIKEIGVHTDLFDIVSDSLLAIQILASVDQVFDVEVPVAMLFDSAFTIAELAKFVELQILKQVPAAELSAALDKLEKLTDHQVSRILLDSDVA